MAASMPWAVARSAGRRFVLQNVIHWVKSIAIERAHAGRASGLGRDLAVGHYKPVNSHRYVNSAHEYIFHFTRRGPATTPAPTTTSRPSPVCTTGPRWP